MNGVIRARLLALAVIAAGCGNAGPPGTPLRINTVDVQFPSSCGGVGLPPFRVEEEGDQMQFIDVGTGTVRNDLVWPSGFIARLNNGVATLYSATGAVVAYEHQVLANAGGCPRSDGTILVDEPGNASAS